MEITITNGIRTLRATIAAQKAEILTSPGGGYRLLRPCRAHRLVARLRRMGWADTHART